MFKKVQKLIVGAAMLAALAFGGAAIAEAASTPGTTTTASSSSAVQTPPSFPAHGTAAHEALEKPVTGDAAAKAQAAAVKYLGGGTAGAVTTDMTGTGFEVTVTKSDGTTVEVHLDSSLNVFVGGHGTQ